MIRVIMGKKGTGKTKQMIDMINQAVQSEHGNVVCIEKGNKLTFDIHYQIRLVDSSEYDVWLNNFGEKNGIKFTITISDEPDLAPEGIKQYF